MHAAGPWPALLDPTARAARDSALDEIVAALAAPGAVSGPGPAGGSAGLALLFAQLAAQGHDGAADIAYQHLDAAVATLGNQATHASLLGGFVGVAWVATVLQDMLEGSRDLSLTADLDDALIEHVATSPWRRDVDLVGGLAGFGLYGLLRHDDEVGRAVIDHVVARLGELAERDGDGCSWFTPAALLPAHQAARFPRGYHNLGLAHGVPGIVGFLAQAAAVDSRDAEEMCTGAVDWLLAQRLPAEAGGGYANTVELGGDDTEPSPSRLAWCYGDPGVATALLVAGQALDRADWVHAAADVALGAASRPAEFSGVLDAGICHGAAGLALVFHRFHQATGHDAFAAAATSWYGRVLDMRRPGTGAGGYQAWEPDGWKDDPGLLTGSAGVALALLAAGDDHAPGWDRILLLSSSVPARDS
ncbi:MAG TPA: lanthionine synthetase C family protein [Candidatus Dormibacteraeota bacterium]|jgi:lantibiotic modifying enzyme|nr:lanthionine synthetase C family protein [Candidatus Dormibacteraeota bacterium]